MNWADKIISYNRTLQYQGKLPKGIRIMNPYAESETALKASKIFYRKYYSDNKPRKLIMGINPGRHGAGATGIPFTDPKRLVEATKIPWEGASSHEPSSVFIYDMINAFGGPELFYSKYFINSVSPLGYTIAKKDGREVNYNYYDSDVLFKSVIAYIASNLETLRAMGFDMETCYCLGIRNARYLEGINVKGKYFGRIIPLEHPRYIMQYRLRLKDDYIGKYLDVLK